MTESEWPPIGSEAERLEWERLQRRVPVLYRMLALDPRAEQTVVVVPSLSLDPRELAKISGVHHYEERMLVNLMLLRQPRTRMVFVTSQQLDPTIVDYYLAMLPGVAHGHVRKRLFLFHCGDASERPLSAKILARPRLLRRIRAMLGNPDTSHMVCFNSSPLELSLAVRLGIPLNSTDPALGHLGTKSGCRKVFREAGVTLPFGFEDLHTPREIAEALAAIKENEPEARRAVVKLDEGFSGEGNAVFSYAGLDDRSGNDLVAAIQARLPTLRFEAPAEHWESFSAQYAQMGGVAEAWVEGDHKASPSAQCRVSGIGEPQIVSTHDQVLGGPSGQVFMGATFPAADAYRLEIQDAGMRVAEVLASKGVIGRFGIDFVSVPNPDGTWTHSAIEVNLRKGGTTHPFLTLKFLTHGSYNVEDGLFYAPSGKPKYYFATDTLQDDRYKGLLPEDLVDISVFHDLHFHGPTERGVVFHLIGALSEYGKLGVVAIGDNLQQARFLYKKTMRVLDEEADRN